MSMTAYNILECRKQRYIEKKEKKNARNARDRRFDERALAPLSPTRDGRLYRAPLLDRSSLRSEARAYFLLHIYYDVYNDTRPSGERESGSYSGTRQRNRIQFGPS